MGEKIQRYIKTLTIPAKWQFTVLMVMGDLITSHKSQFKIIQVERFQNDKLNGFLGSYYEKFVIKRYF